MASLDAALADLGCRVVSYDRRSNAVVIDTGDLPAQMSRVDAELEAAWAELPPGIRRGIGSLARLVEAREAA